MAMITIARDGNNLGNFTDEAVREGLGSGRFLPTDLGWREGMAAWQTLSQFTEFDPVQPNGTPASAQVPTTAAAPSSPIAATVITKTEPLAIWSLALSIAGLFCCGFILGIPGIICGHLALSKIRKEPALQGRGLAIAGLVIGYAAAAFWLLWIVFFGGTAFLQGITQGTSH